MKAIIKTTKLKKFIKIPVNVLLNKKYFLLLFKKRNSKWCKCLLSGSKGLFLKNNLRIIENKFSKAGYHSNKTTNIGDIWLDKNRLELEKSIR